MKRCSKCKQEKDEGEFYKNRSKKNTDNQCKNCKIEYVKDYSSKNRNKVKKYMREYSKKHYTINKDKKLEQCKEYKKNNKNKIRERNKEYSLKRKYGLSIEDWEEMWSNQKGLCGWCGKPMKKIGKYNKNSPVVDHEHIEGYKDLSPEEKKKYVRSLTHSWCNIHYLKLHEDDFEHSILRAFSYPFLLEDKLKAYARLKEMYEGLLQ